MSHKLYAYVVMHELQLWVVLAVSFHAYCYCSYRVLLGTQDTSSSLCAYR